MSKSLINRLTALEEAQSNAALPGNGVVVFAMEGAETREQAIARFLRAPWVQALSVTQHRKLVPIPVDGTDVRA